RLTTAQVRRLQSEKLLLEAKLDWSRIQATLNKPAQASPESTAATQAAASQKAASTPQGPQ
ncbi:MAG: hypothetical protein ABGY71_06470, partial [bacterium]